MPYAVTSFESTPNPNALRCVLDKPASARRRSYRSAAQAAHDPVACVLFCVQGIENVMLLGDWITVGKSHTAKWAKLKPAIKRALAKAQ